MKLFKIVFGIDAAGEAYCWANTPEEAVLLLEKAARSDSLGDDPYVVLGKIRRVAEIELGDAPFCVGYAIECF